MDEYLSRYPNERIIQRSRMRKKEKKKEPTKLYSLSNASNPSVFTFMTCIQRLERYISEMSAMRRVYIVGLAVPRAKYYCLNLSVNYNSLSYLI